MRVVCFGAVTAVVTLLVAGSASASDDLKAAAPINRTTTGATATTGSTAGPTIGIKKSTVLSAASSSLTVVTAATRTDVPVTAEPAGYGHYCSLSYAGGGWAFVTTGTGTDPCGDALRKSPGGTIERAGLWSLAGANNVLVRCGTDTRIYREPGSAPTAKAFAEASGKKGCVFTVSPTKLPVFGKPYGKTNAQQTNVDADVSHTNGFDYAQFGKKLDPSMFGQSGTSSSIIDRWGKPKLSGQNGHDAHDWPMPEGKPILSVAAGIVIASRERNVSEFSCDHATQPETYILHVVGSGEYQERFVSYYAHMHTTSVKTGDRVTRGQQIGTAGDKGCSSGPHLHLGVTRIRNVTAGRFVAFAPVDRAHGDNGFGQRIDPYGWQAPKHIDPWAWMYLGENDDGWDIYRDAGAFSIELWDANAAPPAANW